MPHLSTPMSEKVLSLTPEEAFALLEMCTLTLAEERPIHLQVLSRLGILYRELLTDPLTKEELPLDHFQRLSPSNSPGERLTISCLFV
jgi:hypothetical protein